MKSFFVYYHMYKYDKTFDMGLYLCGQSFWKCPGFPHQWQVGGTILWGFMALMSIGTGVEVRNGRGGTVMEILDFSRDKMVMVLREAELQSPL
jgi:hypothetical protein